jgi:aminopeptidase N
MIAIPDFVSGAMEHWGLVTFRETNLLYDQNKSSTSNKQSIARVIAHEISHMWFGNLGMNKVNIYCLFDYNLLNRIDFSNNEVVE